MHFEETFPGLWHLQNGNSRYRISIEKFSSRYVLNRYERWTFMSEKKEFKGTFDECEVKGLEWGKPE